MNEELKMSYETMRSSSYMAVTCPPEIKLVNYELEMMLSNDIKNFLAASRQMLDGNTVIYFNITSRIPLKQVLDKRKLNRKELFCLIEGIRLAIQDAAAYRLPQAGIVLEAEYIYVNPATCAPAFIFLPLQNPDGQGVKKLLSDLVLRDRIELSNDNFIQKLLVELNREPFSLDELDRNLKQCQIAEPNENLDKFHGNHQQQKIAGIENWNTIPQQRLEAPEHPRPDGLLPEYDRTEQRNVTQDQETVAEKTDGMPKPPSFQQRKEVNKRKQAEKKKVSRDDRKKSKNQEHGEDFDPDRAKKKFLLPQALVMVAVAASISFGLFTNEGGAIAINNILAFVIVVVLAEVILYREVYINSKTPKKQKGKVKVTERKEVHPQKVGMPVPPKPEPSKLQPSKLESLKTVSQAEPPMQVSSQPIPSQSVRLQLEYKPPLSQPYLYNEAEDMDIEVPTELSEEAGGNGESAYLEYYENGRLSRIPLDSFNEVVIGRLERQVDFVLKSPKVGNVHAKFFCQNGQCYVMDINSKNGTYINGSRTRIESNTPYPLRDKDRIMLADSEFTIRCSEY